MRIGIVGAGMIESTLAKLWVDAGHATVQHWHERAVAGLIRGRTFLK